MISNIFGLEQEKGAFSCVKQKVAISGSSNGLAKEIKIFKKKTVRFLKRIKSQRF